MLTSRHRHASLGVALGLILLLPSSAHAGVAAVPDDTAEAAGGGVYALAKAGERVIVGGTFARFGGRERTGVAAVLPDGTVDRVFNPGTDGYVKAVAVSEDGRTVFIGGVFSVAGGAARANLAAVDATTGEALAGWQADTVGTRPDVNSLAVHGDRLYVGGAYTGIDGTTRKRLVALDVATGDVITTFKPNPNGNVREVVVSPDGAKVYAGGAFGKIGGQLRSIAVAELLAGTGTATSFSPTGGSGNVVTVAVSPDGSRVFYSTENNSVLAYDPALSSTPAWSRKFGGNTQGMVASASGELYLGGHFEQEQGTKEKRPLFASIYWRTGQLTPWNPDASGGKKGGWAFLIDGDHLHTGGFARYFGGVRQAGYARFTGSP